MLEIICVVKFLHIWQFSHLLIYYALLAYILLAFGFYKHVWWSSVVTFKDEV